MAAVVSEAVIIDAASVLAGASCAVDGFLIPSPPNIQFRAACDQVHSVRFYVANTDFSAIAAASRLSAYTETAVADTSGTLGNVYSIDAGSYDYCGCVVTNDSAVPATATVAAGYDLATDPVTVGDYCSIADALALLPAVAAARTVAQGDIIIKAITAEINMHLIAKGYELPIADEDALASIKAIAMNGVASRIAKALWPGYTKSPNFDTGAVVTLRADYATGLTFIDESGLAGDVATTDASTLIAHGFVDSAGTAFSSSGLIPAITNETVF